MQKKPLPPSGLSNTSRRSLDEVVSKAPRPAGLPGLPLIPKPPHHVGAQTLPSSARSAAGSSSADVVVDTSSIPSETSQLSPDSTTTSWKENLTEIYNARDFATGEVQITDLYKCVDECGIPRSDHRIQLFVNYCKKYEGVGYLTLPQFLKAVKRDRAILERVFRNGLKVQKWREFQADLQEVFEELRGHTGGAPHEGLHAPGGAGKWAVAACTVDGQLCSFGDDEFRYRLHEAALPFTYGQVLELHGEGAVHSKVGREPSGMQQDELVLNPAGIPHNPLINAGAIACCSLLYPESALDYRVEKLLEVWKELTASSDLPPLDLEYSKRQDATDNRNHSLSFLLAERNVIPQWPAFLSTLSLYFTSQSILLNVRQHAVAAATLAAGGLCPTSGKRVFSMENARRVLSLMLTCGMNEYSGEYCYRIGLPAKSAINGGMMIVIPGMMGIAIYGPNLDKHFNSVRGIELSKQLVSLYNFHQFDVMSGHKKSLTSRITIEETIMSVSFATADNDIEALRYFASEGVDLGCCDYDQRTPLHIAVDEGHYNVAFLLMQLQPLKLTEDRWGKTPVALAIENKYEIPSLSERFLQLFESQDCGALYDPPPEVEIVNFEEELTKPPKDRSSVAALKTSAGTYVYIGKVQWKTYVGKHVYNTFCAMCQKRGAPLTLQSLAEECERNGIQSSDKRMREVFAGDRGRSLTRDEFLTATFPARVLVCSILNKSLVIANWEEFVADIVEIYSKVKASVPASKGKNASYIPPLAKVDSEMFGVALCTIHGQRFSYGDSKHKYTTQSTSKPFTYALVKDIMEEKGGKEAIHQYLGHEPSGKLFNEIVLKKDGTPHNPYINAGAIMCCSLVETSRSVNTRVNKILEMQRRACGMDSPPTINNEVYEGERSSANRNRCLSYFMKEKNVFPKGNDLESTLNVYFKQCSIELNVEEQAIAAATLASGGICPTTNERVFSTETVQDALSLMLTCGMYDFSGEFCYHIGLPAKSGVSGSVIIVIPNVMGIVVFSPPLDELYNSVRGVAFAKLLVEKFPFHQYDINGRKSSPVSHKRDLNISLAALWAAYKGDLEYLQTNHDLDFDQADYDGRTPLHLAACGGHLDVVRHLITRVRVPQPVDRFGRTPLDEAKLYNHERIVEFLSMLGSKENLIQSPIRV